ncbi:MAG: InlB B-repeat-containing protein [Erysipelotrichaceae bacterium]|nr:InlB B-repeat-containing protein [Erysipelotrichaceae bacterium]
MFLKDPAREGYRFLGWAEGDHIPKGSTGEKRFTAAWERLDYPIDYVLNGGQNHPSNPSSYTVEDEVTILDASKEGYLFTGWAEGNRILKGSTGKKTFTAQYEAEIYPITYELDGGTNHKENPSSYTIEDEIVLKDPEKEGYDFSGWKEGDRIPKGSTGEKHFTALWTPVAYPIDYVLNGGINHEDNPSSYTILDDYEILAARREGYTFLRWKEGNHIPPGSTGKKTFTAEYEAVVYPIRYVLNGGVNHPSNPSSYTAEDEISLFDASREGYDFTGWKEGNRIPKGSTGEKTFTALYDPHVYPITYELDGGTNHPSNPSSYTVEDEITIHAPVKDGYRFLGWKEGNYIPKGSTGEKTFTAIYEPVAYAILYELDGGTNDPSNPSSYTIEDEIVLRDPSRNGADFYGWKEGNAIPKGSTGEKVFHAQWRIRVVDTSAQKIDTRRCQFVSEPIRMTRTMTGLKRRLTMSSKRKFPPTSPRII